MMPASPEEITATTETLLNQASMTAEQYMRDAIAAIDRKFGEGFAQEHPELIAGFMSAAAMDFGTAIIAKQLRAGLRDIAFEMEQMRETDS